MCGTPKPTYRRREQNRFLGAAPSTTTAPSFLGAATENPESGAYPGSWVPRTNLWCTKLEIRWAIRICTSPVAGTPGKTRDAATRTHQKIYDYAAT
jgi:hypothetical protein